MNKKNFNVVGNNETENQELAKGIAFIKSRRAELNVVQMVENMRDQALPNGVIINDAYCDRSMTRDYDREALNAFFATLKEDLRRWKWGELVTILDYEWVPIWDTEDAHAVDTTQLWDCRKYRCACTGCHYRRSHWCGCPCHKNSCDHQRNNKYYTGICKEIVHLRKCRADMRV